MNMTGNMEGRRDAPKGKACDVAGCGKESERSVSAKLAARAGLEFDDSLRRVHLCRDHYKRLKKETRELREIESLGR
jgi:hypothetical protein